MSRRAAGLFAGIPALLLALPVFAQVPVVMAPSWDGPDNDLQSILDAFYGPGLIDVEEDYIGADPGDMDPCIWNGVGFEGFVVAEVAGFANRNILGWYEHTGGTPPPLDTGSARVVVPGSGGPGDVFSVFTGGQTFGFYFNPNGRGGAPNAPEPECFYSNRFLNDPGKNGSQRYHLPFDGDPQCLAFDVSAFTQPGTYVLCFEDHDYGGLTFGGTLQETDNDFNDLVIQFTILQPLPTERASFGEIKTLKAP